jgi:antirestriction protein ArdC
MKRDDALKVTQSALERLATALEKGESHMLTAYLETLSRFHHYSFANVMLIASQRPDATHVAGYRTWQELGRHVKKGEHGIAILAPLIYRAKADDEDAQAQDQHHRPSVLRGFKVVHVFDVSQTEGEPLPQFAQITGTPGEHLERIRSLIGKHGIRLEYAPISGGALGASEGGAIRVRPDLEQAEEFSVLVHELAHELLHRGERRQQTTKTVRETEAEAVAFVVSHAIGLESTTRSSDYIQLYSGSKDTLAESLEHIQKTAAQIIEALQLAE